VIASTGPEVLPLASPGAVASDAAAAAELLAVVADPSRLAVLRVLTEGTTCVCKLQERVPVAANLLSYHLKVLRSAGLITGARRGKWIDYSLVDGSLERLHDALPGPSCRSDTGDEGGSGAGGGVRC
jgi:ArsR family transcriptional regulator